MSDNEMATESGGTEGQMGGQAATSLTIGGTFTTGADASLNMSGIDDEMGGDSHVEIYSAKGAKPTSRKSGANDRHYDRAPAPANFPTALNGGAWASGSDFWVQVVDVNGNTTTTWDGAITATAGAHNITLTKRTY